MESLFERSQKYLKERRDNILNGQINSIASPFKRFRDDFVGFEQGQYLCITSYTKGGKTQITLNLLFDAICQYLQNPQAFRLKILYFNLEESDERIFNRYESYLLYKLDKIRISPKDLRSSHNDKPVPQEILDKLESPRYQEYIKVFEECVEFHNISNPIGIYLKCKETAEKEGVVYRKKIKYTDELGEVQESDNGFDYYQPNDPNLFIIPVVDHMGLITPEKGKNLKEALDDVSKNFVKLRNRYNMSPIVIQQQSGDNESNDSIKLDRIRPSGRGLADSKYIQRDRL